MNIYQTNAYVLEARFGNLMWQLRAVANEDDSFIVEPAKNGSLTVKTRDHEGTVKGLHSFYDPEKEAHTLVEKIGHSDRDIFIIVGFGLGYHALALHERLSPNQKILIIEPHPALFKRVLQYKDFSILWNDERVSLIVSDVRVCIEEHIKSWLNKIIAYSNQKVVIDFLPFYERWEQYAACTKELISVTRDALEDVQKIRLNIIRAIDSLRVNGLGKEFFGEYKDCLAHFREAIKEGASLGHEEIGLLTTYFLFSHSSYEEIFTTGQP